MIAAVPFIPESVVAIFVAVIGTAGTLLVARWNAKRADKDSARDDSAVFRGEVLDDNKALRQEVRELRSDIQAREKLIAEKAKEIDALRLENFKHEQRIILLSAQLESAHKHEEAARHPRQEADAEAQDREAHRKNGGADEVQ